MRFVGHLLLAGLACGWLVGGVQAQEAEAQGADDLANRRLPDDVAALVAEIDALGAGDQSADPAGDLLKITDLRRRVEANGQVPDYDLGNLESAEGAAYFYQRDFNAAADAYGRAAVLFEAGNAPPEDMAGLYNNRATILGSVGRYPEAEADHRRALAIRRGIEGERGAMVSSSLFGLGFVYYRQGRVEESLEYIRASAEQQLEFVGPDNPLTIIRLTSLASVLGRSGREAEALEVARRAATLAREHLGEDHPTYAIAVNNLGNALVENRLFSEAVPVLRQALDARLATVGEEASGTAITLRNLATALKGSGAIEESEALNRRALAIYEATGEVENPFVLALMYSELADFAAQRGDWNDYRRLSDQALESADAALEDDSAEQARIHLYRAEWQLRQGEIADARAIAERWVPVMQSDLIETHVDRLWAELLLARLRQMDGDAGADVLELADGAMAQMEAKLADLAVSDRALVREAQAHRESAILYLALAADLGDAERVFRAMQLANISELSRGQEFARSEASNAEGALALRDRLLELARASEELRSRLEAAQAADSEEMAGLTQALAEAEEAERAATAQIRADYPEFVARYRPRPISLADFRSRMDADDLLLAPVEGDNAAWLITIGADSFGWSEAEGAMLSGLVARVRAAVDRPVADLDEFPLDAANALYGLLFPEGTGSAQRILLHGGSRLASLPLGLLVTAPHSGSLADAPWLAHSASVQVIGNLALFGQADRMQTAAATRHGFMGVGGVELPGAQRGELPQLASLFRSGRPDAASIADLPMLPAAAGELRQIAAAFADGERVLLLGPDAAEERFKQADLSDVSVLAFATHGLLAGEVAGLWEPALLLGTSDPDSGEDGLLGASEIARLSLDADWVILSACNTATGRGSDGPTYSGLATAFAQAGARSLLLSHWRVRDDAAARLSVQTVLGARQGLSRAEALRQAQLALMADDSVPGAAHPAIWAPFVLIEN